MKNRLPDLTRKQKIYIVCEGNEEYFYLSKLISLNVWNSIYSIELINAEGNGNIPDRYQFAFQLKDAIILVFCDTEKKPYEQFKDIKRKINEFHGQVNIADEIIFYGNPCTMQIILQHWADIKLQTASKNMNSPIIEQYTGVSNYKGRRDQIIQVMDKITSDNYKDMIIRVENLNFDDTTVGSTNFTKLINYLSSDNTDWIDRINKLIRK